MAFPIRQAVGAFSESASAAISPVWPAHQAGDIGLLLIEAGAWPVNVSVSQGFKELPCSPRFGGISGGGASSLHAFWKRATSAAEPAPTIAFPGTHVRACIVTIRGCASAGAPYVAAVSTDHGEAQITAVNIPGLTTSTPDCLIVAVISNGVDTATSQTSGYTNADLANIVEWVDSNSIIGNGSGLAVMTGERAAAGTIGATTATLANADRCGAMQIAFTAVQQIEDTTPWISGIGSFVESASVAVTPVWPPHETGDIGLLLVESNAWPVSLSTPAGFVEIPNSPQNAGASGTVGATQQAVYWARATSGAMASPVVAWPGGDRLRANIITVRGAAASGDPWDITAGNNNNTGKTTSVSIPGGTTTKNRTLVIALSSASNDNLGNMFHSWVNADLDNPLERRDNGSQIGSGSGLGLLAGRKLTAGAFSSTTATINGSNAYQGRIMLAMKATANLELLLDAGIFSFSGQAAGATQDRSMAAGQGAFAFTGQDVVLTVENSIAMSLDAGLFSITGQDTVLSKLTGRWSKEAELSKTWTPESPAS